jgi:hypothetical protein
VRVPLDRPGAFDVSLTVSLCPKDTLYYPEGGGHLWVYLNWALGLRSLGCRVIWLEAVVPVTPAATVQDYVASLKHRLKRYGLADDVALCSSDGEPLPVDAVAGCLEFDVAAEADLFLNFQYGMPPNLVKRFRRSALVDIDPGLLQIWASKGQVTPAPHDIYFTIGETVGAPTAGFPDLELRWLYTPPCVALDWWPTHRAAEDSPFTTVAHWFASASMTDEGDPDDKRTGFLPYLDLPRRTTVPLELAVDLPDDEDWTAPERATLSSRGWRVRYTHAVAGTPWDYQRYIQSSRGEFSCAKPSTVRLQNAWISDRTVCYLASGKPAVVEHTGASRFLPDAAGLFRFRTLDEAVRSLETVAGDYERQCRLARALAEEHFGARQVVARVLERALS